MSGSKDTESLTLQEKFLNPPDREPFETSMVPTVEEVLVTGKSDIARARRVPGHRELSDDLIADSVRAALKPCLYEIIGG